MDDQRWLAERFEADRAHLRAVAFRMLGSLSEADDAVQEAWLRLHRAGTAGVDNLSAWLTTVVARICLDMLRSRRSRREEPLDEHPREPAARPDGDGDPEHQALLADSVGLAVLVVLDSLTPAERIAFVLHDMFAVPFDQIAPIVGRSPDAAKMLASRARRRVRAATVPDADLARRRHVVDAFLAAARNGDFDALLALLDPDVTVLADGAAVPAGAPTRLRGARAVAGQALAFASRARFAAPALVDGAPGIVVAPRGRVTTVLVFRIAAARIAGIEVIADADRLAQLRLAPLTPTLQRPAAWAAPSPEADTRPAGSKPTEATSDS